MNKAVFLDKDGTLIPDIPYNVDPSLISLQPHAINGLQRLHRNGYLLVVISNQAGVAHGYFNENRLLEVEKRLVELLQIHQIPLSGFYYCPHHPGGVVKQYKVDCDCRKPKPGLIKQAAWDLDINLGRSWMMGDILNDVEAGNRAGCRSVLINNGNETEWLKGECRMPTLTCLNINQAAKALLKLNRNELAAL